MDAKQIRENADKLFSKRTTLNLLWQEIADHFYVERADFAYQRFLGMDYAAHLMTSYPVLMRRELGNQLGTMLRNNAKVWFHMGVQDPRRETIKAKRWLEWAEGVMRRAMYDRVSMFHRAAPEADHDFSAFGQFVMDIDLNQDRDALLYRTWHLRDCVWAEDDSGKVNFVARKWRPAARDVVRKFKQVDPKVMDLSEKSPFEEVNCYHIVVPFDMWEGELTEKEQSQDRKRVGKRLKWVSVYLDSDHNDKVLEAVAVRRNKYIIPRWQTVSGSQYSFSPATVAALPEGRLLQAMTRTILEAGEKAVYPPMIATENVVRSDVAIYAGGITWLDHEYDERLGAGLRPIEQDLRGMPIGKDMLNDSRMILQKAFYLDRLSLPTNNPEMTAFETGQRVAQYIRDALPIFGPMEIEYNAALCEATFETLMHAGTFGSPADMPAELSGAEMEFRFESPLHDLIEAQKGQQLLESKNLLAQVVDIDPTTRYVLDGVTALREALIGSKVPASWVRDSDEVAALAQRDQQQQAAQNMLASMEQGSNVAANLASAQKDMAAAQTPA